MISQQHILNMYYKLAWNINKELLLSELQEN